MAARLLAVVLACLVVVPAAAEVPEATVRRLTDRAAAAGLDPATREAALALVRGADARGLPVGPVADKLYEGALKHVPGPRILAAMRTVVNRLEAAQRLLDQATRLGASGRPAATDLERVAGALGDGVAPGQLVELTAAAGAAHRPVSRVAAAARTLDRLRAMGVYLPEAATALAAAVRAGWGASDLAAVADAWRRHAAAGEAPKAFFRHLGRRAAHGPPPDPAARGRLPDERGGGGSRAPGGEGMGRSHGHGNPYSGDRPNAGNGFGAGHGHGPPGGSSPGKP